MLSGLLYQPLHIPQLGEKNHRHKQRYSCPLLKVETNSSRHHTLLPELSVSDLQTVWWKNNHICCILSKQYKLSLMKHKENFQNQGPGLYVSIVIPAIICIKATKRNTHPVWFYATWCTQLLSSLIQKICFQGKWGRGTSDITNTVSRD